MTGSKYQVGHQTSLSEPRCSKVGDIGERGSEMEAKVVGSMTRRFVDRGH